MSDVLAHAVCPDCSGPVLDRPESDTWECTVCGAEGSGPP